MVSKVYKGRGGRPSFAPTVEQRRKVAAFAAGGIPQDDICKVIGVSLLTLRKHFVNELKTAAIEANGRVAGTALRMAVSGKIPSATFFWLKCRAGWRETDNLDVRRIGPDGAPLGNEIVVIGGLPDREQIADKTDGEK